MKSMLIAFFVLLLFVPLAVSADDDDEWYPLQTGSLSFRIGGFFPNGDSDIWEENIENFTFEMDDFNNFTLGMEYNWFLNRFVTLGFGFDYYSKRNSTEYRDFIGDDDLPIQQEIKLTVVPLTATVKFTPLGNGSPGYRGERGSQLVPWIGGGIGVYSFEYEEIGEFIDFSDFSIFDAEFLTHEATALGFHIAGGLVIPIDLEWDIFGEARYALAKGDLGDDFLGFEPIDLGGFSFHFGASYRF